MTFRRSVKLSIIISLMTATLVYLSLKSMVVRPMHNITDSMVHFRRDLEDVRSLNTPIGGTERELAQTQRRLRDALKPRVRLAALGTANTHHSKEQVVTGRCSFSVSRSNKSVNARALPI